MSTSMSELLRSDPVLETYDHQGKLIMVLESGAQIVFSGRQCIEWDTEVVTQYKSVEQLASEEKERRFWKRIEQERIERKYYDQLLPEWK